MLGARVSRWTMAYFAVALTSFVLAQAWIAAGLSYPALGQLAPPTLVAVHLLTIGWLTLLLLGALQQLVPVIVERPLADDRLGGWSLLFVTVGLVGMIAGFLQLGPLPSLPLGGAAVMLGGLMAIVNLAPPLLRARPWSLPARFVVTGLLFFALTMSLGLAMALALALPAAINPSALRGALFARGLPLHVIAGIGGWFTLTAMGVAYKLLAMFTLAPEHRGVVGDWTFRLSAGGLAAVAFVATARLVYLARGLTEPPALAVMTVAGWTALLAGVVLYLVDMARLYRQRRRARLELNARFGGVSLIMLAVGTAAVGLGAVLGRLPALAAPLVYWLLFGWLSGLGLSQLYKIVPFLTWLERYGPRLGREPVPRVQDLVDERRDQPWFVLYFVAVAVGGFSAVWEWDAAWRAAAALSGLATLAIARELYGVRRAGVGGYIPRPAARDGTPRSGVQLPDSKALGSKAQVGSSAR